MGGRSFFRTIILNRLEHPIVEIMNGAISCLTGHMGIGGWRKPERNRTPELFHLSVFLICVRTHSIRLK